jgi:signal transduction histidine kinase
MLVTRVWVPELARAPPELVPLGLRAAIRGGTVEWTAPSRTVAVALNRGALGLFVAALCQVLIGMIFAGPSYPAWFRLVAFPAFLAAFLPLLAALGTQPHRTWIPALCLLAAAFSLLASWAVAGLDTGAANVAEPLIGLGAFGAGISQDPGAKLGALALIAAQRGGLYAGGTGSTREHLNFLLLETGSFAAAIVGSAMARRLAQSLDTIEVELAQAAKEDARRRVLFRRQLKRSTDLHDVAALTLTVLGLGLLPDSAETRVRCAAEAALLRGEGRGGACDLPARLREVADRFADQGLPVRLDVGPSLPPVADADVVDALVGAVQAALGNAVLHSGAAEASLTVIAHGTGGVQVMVSDRGSGFLPPPPGTGGAAAGGAAAGGGGMGIRVSIVERMEDVHGTATVRSRPGQGTTVTLTWQERS